MQLDYLLYDYVLFWTEISKIFFDIERSVKEFSMSFLTCW